MSRITPTTDSVFVVETRNDLDKPPKAPLLWSARLVLAVMCFLACVNLYAQNACLSLTMVCMLNHTAINSHLQAADAPDAHYGRCPARNGSESNNKSADGEFVWDKETQGLVLGAYFWGYCIPQLFFGIMAQKYGAKYLMLAGMGSAAVGTLVTPLAAKTSFIWLIATRVFMGLTAAVASPSLQALWAKWAPAQERTVLVGMTFAGCETGNIIAFALSGEICAYAGYQTVFYLFGGLSLVWCVFWFLLVSETPARHPRISKEERKYIEASVTQNTLKFSIKEIPWKSIFTSGPFWAILVSNFTAVYGLFLIMTEMPSYMSEVLRFDIKSNGLYSALPYVAVMVVVPFITVAADSLRKNLLSTGNVRKLMMLIGLCGSSGFLVAAGYLECDQTTLAVVFLTLSLAMSACKNGGFLVNHGDIAPKYAGITTGICNSVSVMNGFVAPIVTSFLTEDQTIEEWRRVFWVAAGVMLCGAVFYTIFASGEEQEWAKEKQDTKTTRF